MKCACETGAGTHRVANRAAVSSPRTALGPGIPPMRWRPSPPDAAWVTVSPQGDTMHHRSRHPATLVAAAALAVALAASGCTSKGDAAGSGAPASGPTQITTTTSTPPPPQPITAGEKHFIHVIRAYHRRLNRNMNSGGVLTETSVDATVTIDRACRSTLRKAGDPGRFAPV